MASRYESDMTRKEKMQLEKEKLSKMNFKEKMAYIWEYYKAVIFGIIAVIFIIGTIVNIHENAKYYDLVSIAVVDYAGLQDVSPIEEDIKEALGTGDKYEKVSIDTSYSFGEDLSGADYNTLMAAAKKDYEATLKKPKQSGVKVSAGDRQEDSAHAALLTLQAELRTLEKHAGANEKISQQRRDLWEAENQYVVLKEAATKRQLSEQEKSLLAHEKETLEYKRQLAELGDKIEHQKRLNELAQQAARFEQQQSAKQAAISAKARGLTDRQAQRESEEQRLREVYGDNPAALAKATSALKNTWSAEEQLRGSKSEAKRS